jgi:anti-sigma factor RsiW
MSAMPGAGERVHAARARIETARDGGDVACQDLVEVVTDYLEGDLGEDATRRLEDHLALCTPCADYVAQVRITVHAARELAAGGPGLSAPVRTALLDAYRRATGT